MDETFEFKSKFAKPEKAKLTTRDFWYNFDTTTFKVRSKKVWAHNRKPPKYANPYVPLKIPVPNVYLTFSMGHKGENIWYYTSYLGPRPTTKKVLQVMQTLQADEFKKGKPDIKFNFMVGGDGVVYEGRGWNYRPSLPTKYFYHRDKAVYIGFVGNWEEEPPHPHLLELKDELIKIGVEKKFIRKNHLQIAIGFPCKYIPFPIP